MDYLLHSLGWSLFWLGVGVGITETGWYARWRLHLTRERDTKHDHT